VSEQALRDKNRVLVAHASVHRQADVSREDPLRSRQHTSVRAHRALKNWL
jgi:hypothetical protein